MNYESTDFLTTSITELKLPIYLALDGHACHPPAELALGDSLMVLGLLRNYGKPVKLHFNPLPALLPLLQRHPLVKEICPPGASNGLAVRAVAVPRSGRAQTWHATTIFNWAVPALPVDKLYANPIMAHSLYYRLNRQDDWPSIMLDDSAQTLRPLLARHKPTLVLFPFNPGRADAGWQDESWWVELADGLRAAFNLVAIGAHNYGQLAQVVDAVLPFAASESTLMNLAWLISKAHGFIGRDGGLSHLAAGVNSNIVTVWDSMASYRYWAGSRGHHIIFSNPKLFRHPPRVTAQSLCQNFPVVQYTDSNGLPIKVEMPASQILYEAKAQELLGGMANLASLLMGQMEKDHDQAGVSQWMSKPQLKIDFYRQSLGFAQKAINRKLALGHNWVVPLSA